MSSKRGNNHTKAPNKQPSTVEHGEAYIAKAAHEDGHYVKVKLEYKSRCAAGESMGGRPVEDLLAEAAAQAIQAMDVALLVSQREDEISEEPHLTPDGTTVVERWLQDPYNSERIITVAARKATPEDFASLPAFGESAIDRARRHQLAKASLAGIQVASTVPA